MAATRYGRRRKNHRGEQGHGETGPGCKNPNRIVSPGERVPCRAPAAFRAETKLSKVHRLAEAPARLQVVTRSTVIVPSTVKRQPRHLRPAKPLPKRKSAARVPRLRALRELQRHSPASGVAPPAD